MGFLGPVSKLGDRLVRPHDVAISLVDADGATEAMVSRVVHLGFEVRVELDLPDRSEEHTSELQSHVNLVCRLLLEKKKKIKVSFSQQLKCQYASYTSRTHTTTPTPRTPVIMCARP